MARLIRPFAEVSESSEDVFLISLSDLAWNLVVVFIAICASMMADTTARLRELDLQMGETRAGTNSSDPESPIATVTVSVNGDVAIDGTFLGDATMVKESLLVKLRASASQDAKRNKVWVVPDRGASWGQVSLVHGLVSDLTDNVIVITREENQE